MNTDKSEMLLRKATAGEKDAIAAIYSSVIGQEGCTWNEYYPGETELREGLETGNLYVLACGSEIVGTVSVVNINELDELGCWQVSGDAACEIARVAIHRKYQGHGYSGLMIKKLFEILISRGFRAVHILVAARNIAAQKVYKSAGFTPRAECDMYEDHYYAYEKLF